MQKDSGIQWDHSHDFGVDNENRENKVKIVFALTTVIMVLEIGAGTWSGSMALLADGWHMGTHSAAFAIAMFAYFYAKKHANNKEFSFGTGKVNYLGGFASAVALAIVGLMMAIESVQRLIEPQAIHFNEAIVSLLSDSPLTLHQFFCYMMTIIMIITTMSITTMITI